jgi:hypothetical protein
MLGALSVTSLNSSCCADDIRDMEIRASINMYFFIDITEIY